MTVSLITQHNDAHMNSSQYNDTHQNAIQINNNNMTSKIATLSRAFYNVMLIVIVVIVVAPSLSHSLCLSLSLSHPLEQNYPFHPHMRV